jgi:two-component sensor histidine kinase
MSGWASGTVEADKLCATENEALLRETHHRINNHLQILASLLGLEARTNASAEAAEALMGARRRILAIARLNGELQNAKVAGEVDLRAFLTRFGEDMRDCFSSRELLELPLKLDVEPAQLPAEQAVTVALIINELVTNAVKHAVLPHGGGVLVRLRRLPDRCWRLTVSDEGPGLPPDAFDKPEEHGLDLIRILVRQLRGELTVDRPAHGAAISVRFH